MQTNFVHVLEERAARKLRLRKTVYFRILKEIGKNQTSYINKVFDLLIE